MTNGGGPGHGRKRGPKASGKGPKAGKAEARRRALERKGWMPEKLARAKTG